MAAILRNKPWTKQSVVVTDVLVNTEIKSRTIDSRGTCIVKKILPEVPPLFHPMNRITDRIP
jgi:hypothetical protein